MRKMLYFLSQFTDEDVAWFMYNCEKRSAGAGDVLIHFGEPLTEIYITLSGSYEIRGNGESAAIALVSDGEMLGEMSFIDHRPPSASVICCAPGAVLSLARTDLARKLDTDAAFSARFYRSIALIMSDRIRHYIASLGYTAIPAQSIDLSEEDINDIVSQNLEHAGTCYRRLVSHFHG